jgi:hypothetical protein
VTCPVLELLNLTNLMDTLIRMNNNITKGNHSWVIHPAPRTSLSSTYCKNSKSRRPIIIQAPQLKLWASIWYRQVVVPCCYLCPPLPCTGPYLLSSSPACIIDVMIVSALGCTKKAVEYLVGSIPSSPIRASSSLLS